MRFGRQASAPVDWLVVGLGNPGPEYSGNRHNVGFGIVEALAARMGGRFKSHKARADVIEGRLAGQRVVLAKPRSYMNESGGPVRGLLDYHSLPVGSLVVVHDELDIPFSAVRLKWGGGEGEGTAGRLPLTAGFGRVAMRR